MKRMRLVAVTLVVASALVGAIALWHATEERAPIPAPVRLQAGDTDVAFTGDISQPTVRECDNVRFWVTIQNRGAVPLRDVRLLTHDLPGFELTSGCWCPRQGRTCLPTIPIVATPAPTRQANPPAPECEQVVSDLAAGQTLTVWGDLRATRSQPPTVLSVVARWTPGDHATSQAAIPLGSVEVRTHTVEILASVRQFAKDFGLSLTLALLGFLFTRWEKRRQDRQQAAEKAREQVIETWNTMLPVSHALNTALYIKILRAVHLLVKHVDLWRATRPDSLEALAWKRRAFFSWALMRRHIRDATEKGGFYFKDRTGERLTGLCVVKATELFQAAHGNSDAVVQRFNQLMKQVDLDEKLGDFLKKLDDTTDPLFGECLADFELWIASEGFPEALLCLRGLGAVLEYEINRPYQYWYGSSEKLEVDGDVRGKLLELAVETERREPSRKGLVATVERYLSEGTGQTGAHG